MYPKIPKHARSTRRHGSKFRMKAVIRRVPRHQFEFRNSQRSLRLVDMSNISVAARRRKTGGSLGRLEQSGLVRQKDKGLHTSHD